VEESSLLSTIGNVADKIVFLTRILKSTLQGNVIICCDNEREKPLLVLGTATDQGRKGSEQTMHRCGLIVRVEDAV
jgi:hypothetical protein